MKCLSTQNRMELTCKAEGDDLRVIESPVKETVPLNHEIRHEIIISIPSGL